MDLREGEGGPGTSPGAHALRRGSPDPQHRGGAPEQAENQEKHRDRNGREGSYKKEGGGSQHQGAEKEEGRMYWIWHQEVTEVTR